MDITLYQKMYAIICAAASDAVDLLSQKNPLQAKFLLEQALLRAEELYLSYEVTTTDTE